MQQSKELAPDNRSYSVFFISVRLIKISFRMNNFKNSDRFFKWIRLQFDNENYAEE